MTCVPRVAVVIGVLLILMGSPATAQELYSEGAWSETGAGIGWNPNDVARDGASGSLYHISFGLTLSRSIRLGIESVSWRSALPFKSGAEAGSVTINLIAYPLRTLTGPQLRVGAGLGDADVWDEGVNGWSHPTGFAATAGVGWGVRVSSDGALSLRFDWTFQSFGASQFRPSTNHMLALTLAVTSP